MRKFLNGKYGGDEMLTQEQVKIFKAILELVDAKPKDLDIVSGEFWEKSKTVTRNENEKRFIRASDITALVRERNKRK